MRTQSDNAGGTQPREFEKRQHSGRSLLWSSLAVMMIVVGAWVMKLRLPHSANGSGNAVQYRVLNRTTDSNGLPTTAARFCVGSGTQERSSSPSEHDPPFGLNTKPQQPTSKPR